MSVASLLILNIASLFSFIFVYASVNTTSILGYLDSYIYLHIPQIWSQAGNAIVVWLTYATEPVGATVILVILLLALAKRKLWRFATLVALASPVAIYSSKLLKVLVGRSRPTGGLFEAGGFAFPSTHATVGGLCLAGLIWIKKASIPIHKKWISGTALLVTALFLGASRIYLNVHWSSDVIAGYLLGFFWATFFMICYKTIWRKTK